MADHPLRSATDRSFGGPLPRQQANQTRIHPVAINLFPLHHAVLWAYAVLAAVSHCYPPLQGRLSTRYSPVRHSLRTEVLRSFDLHVLGTPPAFILSQDQTLNKNISRPKALISFFPVLSGKDICACFYLFPSYCLLRSGISVGRSFLKLSF